MDHHLCLHYREDRPSAISHYDTYHDERHPTGLLTMRQAFARFGSRMGPGAEVPLVDYATVAMGYRYRSSAVLGAPEETVVGFFEAARGYDPLAALRSYGGPMHSVVTPINDEPFSLHNLHPDLSHTTFEGTGHWLHMDEPERFNSTLDGFLARTPCTVHA